MRGAQLWRWGQLKCGHSPWTDPLFCFVFLALPFLLYVYCGKRGSWPKVVVAIVRSLSHVQLFAAPWTIAHQPPLSMGFLRQEHWSMLPFPSPGDLSLPGLLHWRVDSLPLSHREVYTYINMAFTVVLVAQSCPTPCNPMDYSPPGSSVHGVFQARTLECIAISFSRGFPVAVCVCICVCVCVCVSVCVFFYHILFHYGLLCERKVKMKSLSLV